MHERLNIGAPRKLLVLRMLIFRRTACNELRLYADIDIGRLATKLTYCGANCLSRSTMSGRNGTNTNKINSAERKHL